MDTRLGSMIRLARKKAGLRLEDVAEQVGVTAGALSHIESGRRLPNPQNAVLIAEVLGIPSEDLLVALDEEHAARRRGSVDSWRSSGKSDRSTGAIYSACRSRRSSTARARTDRTTVAAPGMAS